VKSEKTKMKTLIVETKGGGLVKWNINSKCREAVAPIATEFAISVERFLQLYTQRKLPGELSERIFSEEQDENVRLEFDFDSLKKCPAWKRIERAAKASGESVNEFLIGAIMEFVRSLEEDMILSPSTSEVIADGRDLESFRDR